MKKSRFTEEQILFALRQSGAGTPVTDICRCPASAPAAPPALDRRQPARFRAATATAAPRRSIRLGAHTPVSDAIRTG